MRKEEQWQTECMEEREITVDPGAKTIPGQTERKELAQGRNTTPNIS